MTPIRHNVNGLTCKMRRHRLDCGANLAEGRKGTFDMSNTEDSEPVVQLVTTRSEAEIAADLKKRLLQEIRPVLAIFDEAASYGLTIQWDGISPLSPRYKHELTGLRIVKYL